MHPTVFNQLKEKLYTRLTHHRYLLGVCGKTYTKLDCQKKAFPFEIDTVHEAIARKAFVGGGSCKVSQEGNEKPHYIVMMPVVLPSSQAKLNNLIRKFFNEACESLDEKQRTALVIGINARRGLDSSKLNQIYEFYQKWKKVPFSCVVMGFVWEPQYSCSIASWKYDVYKTYRILELIDRQVATAIKNKFDEVKVSIPYVNIRESILTARMTQLTYDKFKKSKVIYLGIADPDAKNFNRVIKGADIELENFKESKGEYPDIFSPGYEAPEDQPQVIQKGLKIDRLIRTETNKFIGMGSYFSETFFLFRVKKSPDDFSFVTKETKKNQALESRRLFQNGVKKGLIDPEKVHHGGEYPIVTTVMDRMKTSFTESSLDMYKENLFTLQALKSICGLTYSHLSPREWANNLYAALPISASNTQSVIIPLQQIFKVVHPIYAGYEFLGRKFGADDFDEWLVRFNSYLTCIDNFWATSTIDYPMQQLEESNAQYEKFKQMISAQCEILNQAWTKLSDAGLDDDWINKIYYAAYFSGSKTSNLLYEGEN